MKKKKLKGRGGPGRGQGKKKLKVKDRRVKVSFYILPAMLRKIKAKQKITDDTLSSTIVYLIDHGLNVAPKNQKSLIKCCALSNDQKN